MEELTLDETLDELYQQNRDLQGLVANQQKQIDFLTSEVFTQSKTIEGIQNLFIRAGEYKGKPRGRLPR